jgi:ATP-dependent protease ClpP protease subunit
MRKKVYAKIYINGEITETTLIKFQKDFDDATEKKASLILLEITSQGGLLYESFAIVNRIKASRIPIITVASGCVMSAAVPIFLSGKKRLIRPLTYVMIHEVSYEQDGQTSKLTANLNQLIVEQDKYCQFVSEHSKLSLEALQQMIRVETFFNPDEAISHGLADELVEKDS